MNITANLEHRASSSQSKHEGEPSLGLCDRPNRTRDNSQRQLPTRFRPANIRLINRRSHLPRLLPVLSSSKTKSNGKYNPTDFAELTRSLHISPCGSAAPGIETIVDSMEARCSKRCRSRTFCCSYQLYGCGPPQELGVREKRYSSTSWERSIIPTSVPNATNQIAPNGSNVGGTEGTITSPGWEPPRIIRRALKRTFWLSRNLAVAAPWPRAQALSPRFSKWSSCGPPSIH